MVENIKSFRHGDKYLVEIDIQESSIVQELSKSSISGKCIFAHGEDGHNHILYGKIKSLKHNKEIKTIQVLEDAQLKHEDINGHGDHLPYVVPAGLYKVVTERSYNIFMNEIRLARD